MVSDNLSWESTEVPHLESLNELASIASKVKHLFELPWIILQREKHKSNFYLQTYVYNVSGKWDEEPCQYEVCLFRQVAEVCDLVDER